MTDSSRPSERAVRIGFVQATWHREVVDSLRDSFGEHLAPLVPGAEIDHWEVPGSLEIPLLIRKLAERGAHDIYVAAGLIVDGGIYRHEFVAREVLRSVMEIGRDHGVAVIYAVLTPHHFHGAEHEAFFREHFVKKGEEAARACAATLANLRRVEQHFGPSNPFAARRPRTSDAGGSREEHSA